MKQIIIATIFLSVLGSCNNPTKKKKSTESEKVSEQNETDFEVYISTLDQIILPLEMNPLVRLPEFSKNFDKNKFEKYKHTWTSHPLGIYYQDEKTVGIIDYSAGDWGPIPFLTTYDLKGNKIDSTKFYDKSGQDMGYDAIEYLTFYNNRKITVLDTVKSWELNNDKTDIIRESLKITTGKIEFRVLENGRIEKNASR